MSGPRVLLLAAALAAVPARASADATAFLGTNTTPNSRTATGLSLGIGVLLIGFEFEYAGAAEDENDAAPSLRTGMGNILLQTPFEILRMQPYFTAGGGIYRERLDALNHQETNVAGNTGGGVKVACRSAPGQVRLPHVPAGRRPAVLTVAPVLRRIESEVLNGRIAGWQD
jgi:hypothetical protein